MLRYRSKESKEIKRLMDEVRALRIYLKTIKALPQVKSVMNNLGEKSAGSAEETLLPRRREILETVKYHPYCSFDFISRRFFAVNKKTLHYDLKKLQDEVFIIKVGKTRGATYKVKE